MLGIIVQTIGWIEVGIIVAFGIKGLWSFYHDEDNQKD